MKKKTEYKITDYRPSGAQQIVVENSSGFSYVDLYEFVGKSQFMTTFYLKPDGNAFTTYGDNLLGTIFYDFETKNLLKSSELVDMKIQLKILIDSSSLNLSQNQKEDLKNEGVLISEIEKISFLPYVREIEHFDTGEKRINDVIKVEFDPNSVDPDILCQNYLASKHNHGIELIQYEKEKLLGIILAFNNGSIDEDVVRQFGFTEASLTQNLNVQLNFLKVKNNRDQLKEEEKKQLRELEDLIFIKKLPSFLKELHKSGTLSHSKKKGFSEAAEKVIESLLSNIKTFSPAIVMNGSKQIYWDIDSYIHITLRHVKEYQLVNFVRRTPFSYKPDDLKLLIEQVLKKVELEIQHHFSEHPNKIFRKSGKKAVQYNGDYYQIRIDSDGRLSQFHALGDKPN